MLFEYCPGGDLKGLLKKLKRLNEDIVKTYAAEIAFSISCLHKSNIVYTDYSYLKPDNVAFGKDGHCLLTDFGI